ncbi:S1 family peptidase [Phytohabitans rumicis]|uniref:Peptidase S1 domain-containing protein n=1 Tax=Phytohabitans rumicis TaxID=1076125 RepID=A0A6V8LNC3_9ACTN|nr:S1 family peptidase [Phytohabitans rumicis]GFJ96139.1 hypothetical protein Prum_097810 [Phytohabitans rumicis]
MRVLIRRGLAAGVLAGVVAAVASLAAAAPAFGVAGGAPAPADGYGFVADVKVGDGVRGCSGALVDPEWIVTAKSCFAQGAAPIPVGPPVYPTTVTVGRENLATTTKGQVRTVIHVVPHVARDLLLAKLASPVIDVAPVKIGTTAPVVGDVLQVAGFGRTAADWVPDRLHLGSFAVQSVATAALDVAGDQATPASVCKGDAGGPALRGTGAAIELVAVNGASWQSRCHGADAAETRNLATEARLDNIKDWVRRTVRGSNFVRLGTSAQVLDTRGTGSTPAAPLAGGSTTSFQVTGVGGVPASGVTAVLLDVTAVTTAYTYLTVFPDGTPLNPALSMVNAAPNQFLSNTAVVPVPANGKLAVYNHVAGTHVVADVQGYYTSTATAGGGFVPVDYTRLVDTRTGLGGSTGVVPAWGSRTFTLTGGVIPAGTGTAFVDLVVVGATGYGWIGAYPAGGANDRSVMDYAPGQTSHGIAVKLDASGRATITNNGTTAVHFLVTATGYFTTSATGGAGLRTLAGTRKLDTRTVGEGGPVLADATVDAPLGVPAGAAALVNLTVFQNNADGHFQAWPVGGNEPAASLTNYPGPNTTARSGLAVVRVGTDGKIRIRNVSAGTAHILVDLQGWYANPLPGDTVGTTASTASTAEAPVDEAVAEAAVAAADSPGATVEDYLYPNAAQILEDLNVRLISGDGHIVLADCDTPAQGDIGLLEVYTTDQTIGADGLGLVCFKVRAPSGILNLEVPGVFEIRGDGQRTGTGHEVTAELISDDGEEITVDVDPDGSTQVGLGTDPDASPTMLLRLTVTG